MKKLVLPLAILAVLTTAVVVLAAPPEQAPEGEPYIIQADDWLSKIADKFLGDMMGYPGIVDATNAKAAEDSSFAVITNPDVIEIGQKLWIPAAGESRADADRMLPAPVTEIAIRRLIERQDVTEFAAARDSFVALLKAQPGVTRDREFAPFLDFATFAPPEPPVFIGMTEYESMDAFGTAGQTLGQSAAAGAFFATFTPEVFTVLQPLNPNERYELARIAAAPGQVLEIAARDLSTYENFDPADYETKRDAFLAELARQDGFVAEYQWVSALDPNIVVGMTVYDSVEAFQAIATSAFAQSAANADFLGGYPPLAGYVSVDARAAAE